MKCSDTVVLPLVRKQDILKPIPNPLTTFTLTPYRDIDTPYLIDSNQPGAEVVEAEAALKEISSLFHILNPQRNSKPPETPL